MALLFGAHCLHFLGVMRDERETEREGGREVDWEGGREGGREHVFVYSSVRG